MHGTEEKGIHKAEKGREKTTRRTPCTIILKWAFKNRFTVRELVYDRHQRKAPQHS
jgi:hypothetical protein